MPRILVIADESWARNEVHAALPSPDYELVDNPDPRTAARLAPGFDAVIADLQVGSMGGMAVVRAVRAEGAVSNKDVPPVVVLLDRKADAFLADRAGAAGWVTKPFTAHELRTVLAAALTGGDETVTA